MKKFTPLRESMNIGGPANSSYNFQGDARESIASKNRGISSSIYSSSKKLNLHGNTAQKRPIKPNQVSSSLLNPIKQTKTQKKESSMKVDEIQMFDTPLDSAEYRTKPKRLGQPKSALKPKSIMKSPGTASKKVYPPAVMGRTPGKVDTRPKWNSGGSQAFQDFDISAKYRNNYVQSNFPGQLENRKAKIREHVKSEVPEAQTQIVAPLDAFAARKGSQVSGQMGTRNGQFDGQQYQYQAESTQSEFKKSRKSRQMRSTRTSIDQAILPVDLRPRADVSAQMEDKVQKHQDELVKRIMEKEELKKKKGQDEQEDTTQTQYFQMLEAPSQRSVQRSLSSNAVTREQKKQMFLNQQKLLDAEQKLEQMEKEKEELERLRKLEVVNQRDKERNLKQRERSEARRLDQFNRKLQTMQPVESNIDFGDEESGQLEIEDGQTLPSASTSTAQVSRQEKRKRYLAQQKLLDQLEKAEDLEKQVKDTEFIRNKERIVEINRRANSRSLGKSQTRQAAKKQAVAVPRLPIQEIEVRLQSVDIEDFEEEKFDPELIQVIKQPSSAERTGGQGIQGMDRGQLALIKKRQRDQARAISDLEIEKEEQQVYKDISVREKSVSKLKMSQSRSNERLSRQQQQSNNNYFQTHSNIDTIQSQPFSIQEENLATESDIADEMQANIQTINNDYTTNQMTNQERFLTAGLSSNGQLTSDRSNLALVSVSDISKPPKKKTVKKKMTSPVKGSPNKANLIRSIEVQSPSKKLSSIKSKPSRPTPPAVSIGKPATGKKSALGPSSPTKLTKSPSKKVIKKV